MKIASVVLAVVLLPQIAHAQSSKPSKEKTRETCLEGINSAKVTADLKELIDDSRNNGPYAGACLAFPDFKQLVIDRIVQRDMKGAK